MSEEVRPVKELLEERENDYLLNTVRIKMRSSTENLDVGEFHIEKLAEGESVELPRWVAEELVGQGMAESSETPFEKELFSALSREKMMGPLQLSPLPPHFYMKMRRRLEALSSGAAEGRSKKEDSDRLRAVCYDLVGIRLSKLLSLSSSSTPASSLADKLTPEEASFFAISQSLSREWKSGLLGGGM